MECIDCQFENKKFLMPFVKESFDMIAEDFLQRNERLNTQEFKDEVIPYVYTSFIVPYFNSRSLYVSTSVPYKNVLIEDVASFIVQCISNMTTSHIYVDSPLGLPSIQDKKNLKLITTSNLIKDFIEYGSTVIICKHGYHFQYCQLVNKLVYETGLVKFLLFLEQ